jgi:hypothetical protein
VEVVDAVLDRMDRLEPICMPSARQRPNWSARRRAAWKPVIGRVRDPRITAPAAVSGPVARVRG